MVTETTRPPLRRSVGTPVAGVCLGLSRHLGVSAPVVRAVMIGLFIAGGIGILLYCWLWIFVPSEEEPEAAAGVRGLSGPAVDARPSSEGTNTTDATESRADGDGVSARVKRVLDSLTSSPEVLLGGLLLGAAALLGLSLAGLPMNWRLFGPPAVLVVGILLAWSQVDKTGRGRTDHAALWQIAAGAGLVLVALLVIAGGVLPGGDLLLSLVVAMMLLAGIALVIAPWLIRLYRTMTTERSRAAAEAERADIAAHLHDSVLQTLAMIQKQRHDPVMVEQLARSQERQLRGWLYRQQRHEPGTLKDHVTAAAAELEDLHATPVDVVAVGESRRDDHRALVGAAREAIVNALQHAGPASVYLESDDEHDAIFVRDRGGGFDIGSIDEDRLGVRESIIGRMRRAGGEARIRSDGGGTEVELSMPVDATGEEEHSHD